MLQVIGSKSWRISRVPRAAWIALIMIAFGLWSCANATNSSTRSGGALRSFLQKNVGMGPKFDKDMRYSFAVVSLHGHSKGQIIVYLSGMAWCGSGGCTELLLEPHGSSFRIINKFTLARLPIRILPSKSHGWHDLAMPVGGGGIIHRYLALLRFNGHKYPSNPSMAPKLPTKLAGTGTEVPLSESGSLVY